MYNYEELHTVLPICGQCLSRKVRKGKKESKCLTPAFLFKMNHGQPMENDGSEMHQVRNPSKSAVGLCDYGGLQMIRYFCVITKTFTYFTYRQQTQNAKPLPVLLYSSQWICYTTLEDFANELFDVVWTSDFCS